ncbi:hypothetical protein BKA61DRAFT_141061 [Leptodontidium sp. MPI-SDFR-AT-0119]|nr:hypothetical protein BKA61DRAFT_141061 [Leptodontidium sp. MPI-SDFR-AT-0119]
MASTCMQTVEPGPNGSQDRSPEEIALHKAEKKKRKYERKQKRKAKKAAKLIEQTPTPAQEDAPAPSTPSPVRSVPINNEGLKSARAHYSPVPANVSPQLVKKPEILPKSADDEPDSDEEILERSFANTRSSDPLAKESIQSVCAVVDQASTLSPSVMSTSEYDNSVVMVDRPERGTDDDMVMQKVSTAILDSDEDGSIEETIITQGAQATLSRGSRPLVPKRHLQAIDLSADPDESNDEELISLGESDPRGRDPEQIKPKRHAGFPAPEDLPGWFPTNIKQIYRVDRHGGALSFKELNEITRYRAALERIRRQKWNAYIEAGEARWKLQKIRRRLRTRPLTKAFSQYRNKQYQVWKEKALKAWKRLEKTHLGVSILDETININFRQERIIYEKKLGGRL